MSLDVQGFEEISRALIDMSNRVNRQTQDRALEAGAEILEAEIKSDYRSYWGSLSCSSN